MHTPTRDRVRRRPRFDPFSAEFRRDPYPVYRRLRESEPVHRTFLGVWVLTSHADIRQVLHSSSFSSEHGPRLVAARAERLGRARNARTELLGERSLLFTDDPYHARLRGLVNRVFTSQAVAGLHPLITGVVAELLRAVDPADGFDVITDFAAGLPVRVLCDWMALPRTLYDRVGPWTRDIWRLLDPGTMTAADFDRADEAADQFVEALSDVLAERRCDPGPDLISGLLAARTAGVSRSPTTNWSRSASCVSSEGWRRPPR